MEIWLNAAEHFVGNHAECGHHPNADCFFWKIGHQFPFFKKRLESFLIDTSPIIRRTSDASNNQSIESINSNYGKMCSKNLSWKYTQFRLDATILKHNEPQDALVNIANCCNAKISDKALKHFRKESNKTASRNAARRTPEYRKIKNEHRWNVRRKNKSVKNDGYIIKNE